MSDYLYVSSYVSPYLILIQRFITLINMMILAITMLLCSVVGRSCSWAQNDRRPLGGHTALKIRAPWFVIFLICPDLLRHICESKWSGICWSVVLCALYNDKFGSCMYVFWETYYKDGIIILALTPYLWVVHVIYVIWYVFQRHNNYNGHLFRCSVVLLWLGYSGDF